MSKHYTPVYNTNAAEIISAVHLSGKDMDQAQADSLTMSCCYGSVQNARAAVADLQAVILETKYKITVPSAGEPFTGHCADCDAFMPKEKNQCDGCNARMTLLNGNHYRKDGHLHMACEARLYRAAI